MQSGPSCGLRTNKETCPFRKKGRKVVREFLVRWRGFGLEDDSWEPEEGLKELDVYKAYVEFAGLS